MVTQLETTASNIQTWIDTNKPDATIDDLVGKRNIVETTDAVRELEHPYLNPDSTPEEWDEVPDNYKAILNIQYDTIDETFFSEDIAGKRMTLFFDEELA